ncbi:hypothetical protein FRC06_009200 [Ceratobasidium sp. 370]|nr:hypothetical protein FRC06_009200 [Ceratobasidium sp. 370]
MPAQHINSSPSACTTPLPKGHYTVPNALPPAFGVDERFDWSLLRTPVSSSSRSSSTGHSTFRRFQHKTSRSVRSWVEDQQSCVGTKDYAPSDILSISSTTTKSPPTQPLFAPSRSPTPAKPGSSQVSLQLRSTPLSTPSPLFAPPTPPAPSTPPGLPAPSSSPEHRSRPQPAGPSSRQVTSRPKGPSPSGYLTHQSNAHPKPSDNRSDVQGQESNDNLDEDFEAVYSDASEGQDGGYGSGEESKPESELSDSGRMRTPMHVSILREVRKEPRSGEASAQAQSRTSPNTTEWSGGQQGVLHFRKRPNSQELIMSGKWTFSRDGVSRQPLMDRRVGNIHFSPGFSGTVK